MSPLLEDTILGDADHIIAPPVSSASFPADLNDPYVLTDEQRAFFNENGFIKLKHVLKPQTLEFYGKVISEQVQRLNTQHLPIEQRDVYGRAFLQVMNIWTKNAVVKEFVFGKKLARLAAELLGVSGVRLYHDQALYKEPHGGKTPWHADQFYWPLDTDRTVTAWIPLQQTPLGMGPLAFAPKTHRLNVGRDVAISEESEQLIGKTLHDLQMEIVETPYDLGEVSFHLGWNWHRAGANHTDRPRRVMTVIYMDEDAKMIAPRHGNHVVDADSWLPGVKQGQPAASPLNPVLWSSKKCECCCGKNGGCRDAK